MEKIKVLFVCLGNICRSPLIEGVFAAELEKVGLQHAFIIDSAGTHGYHTGSLPDTRSRKVAKQHGIELTHRARQLQSSDLDAFHYIFLMDESNLEHARRLGRANFHLARTFDPLAEGSTEVPDPYYGNEQDFENVYQMVKRISRVLTDNYRETGSLTGY